MEVSSVTMKITEQKTETVTRDVVTDIICNLCGESCLDTDGPHNDLGVEVTVHGCYGSAFPGDLTSWKFHLCELCVAFLVSRFKLFPDMEDNMDVCDIDRFKALLTNGEMDDYVDWVKVRYAKAMSRVALFSSEEAVRLASSAAKSAADELENQRKQHREEAHAMHAALDKIAAPHSVGDRYPVDRVASLAGSTDDRLLAILRKMRAVMDDVFRGKPVDRSVVASVLTDAEAYLDAVDKKL